MSHLVVFGLILICCHARIIEKNDQIAPIDEQANKVEKFLEDFKTKMKTGDEELGLPILDPFVMKEVPLKVDEEMIKVDGFLTNLRVDSLSEYNVLSGNFQLIGLKFSMNLSWPQIVASTDYAIDATVNDFEIYGKGKIDVAAHDFVFGTTVTLVVNGKYLKVKSLSSKFSLKALDFKITGLFNDEEVSEVISSVISDIVPEFINNYQDQLAQQVDALLTKQLDAFLATKTIGDLLRMFG
ncbi:hypothetical protein DMN91_006735 [Ooceraea biroi]|nr:hypothetical protein DMN91_006735 [Ooceraea biroi]